MRGNFQLGAVHARTQHDGQVDAGCYLVRRYILFVAWQLHDVPNYLTHMLQVAPITLYILVAIIVVCLGYASFGVIEFGYFAPRLTTLRGALEGTDPLLTSQPNTLEPWVPSAACLAPQYGSHSMQICQ